VTVSTTMISAVGPSEPRRTVASRDGTLIRCLHGPLTAGRGAVMIALPFGVPAKVAEAAFAAFDRDFNVLTWESRLILDSDVCFTGEEPMSPDDHVADMMAILAGLEIKQCRLIGYCSGAGISLLAASIHPEVFTHLILVNGEYQLFRAGHEATAYQRSIDAFLPEAAEGREQATAMFQTMSEISSASRAGAEQPEFERLFNAPFSSAERLFRYASNYMAYRDFDALTLAREIRQPTDIVLGGRDSHAGVENSRAICEAIGGARPHLDEAGDHYSFCRAGSRTLELVSASLARTTSLHTQRPRQAPGTTGIVHSQNECTID
jgi:pimeloyl-ACP methyl ester carboxylesterase